MALLLIAQFVAFSLFPLYFTTLPAPSRRTHFYTYIALILLVGGFMGNVYSLPIADGIVVSGGNLCYGAFMMASVMFVWVERDAFILRHLVRLVVLVDIFNIVFSFLTHSILETDGVINPHAVPSGLFEISTPLIALGGILIVSELLLLLFIFEAIKKRKTSLSVTAAIYILSFVLVLVLDGIAFPFIAFGINAQIVAVVIGGLAGKILIAIAYGMPLALFVLWKRQAFIHYLETDTVRWRLLASSSADLIKEMTIKDQDVRRGDIVFKNSTDGLAIVNRLGQVLKANAAFRAMLGINYDHTDQHNTDINKSFWIDGTPVSRPYNVAEQWRREVMFGADRHRPGILSITPAGEDASGGDTFVYSLTDITEQKTAQAKLEYLASRDHLTGLPNRRTLDKSRAGFQNVPHALIIIDLDYFGDVNDSYGHGVGDRVLQLIAERLDNLRENYLASGDVLCRLGGDEFAFLIQSGDQSFVEGIIEKIQSCFGQTVHIRDELEVLSSATIGVSYHLSPEDHDALLGADAALYEAKRSRRGSVGVYEDRLTTQSQKRVKLGLKLKNAITNNELDVYYQPQFTAVGHELHGVEALVRWSDPELGIVSPADFIPVVEETGLIEALGEYVLERACRDGQEWLQAGYLPVTLSVNTSASQLRFGRFIPFLKKVLSETGFPARQLEIEITESTYIERENEVSPLLNELREMGVGIAIDDFGTGYSCLSYLAELPCSCIKIDRSFITDIPTDAKQCSLTSAIISLAKGMSFKVVVEGVETREQLDFLTKYECDLIQGFYFSGALSKAELAVLLRRSPIQSVDNPVS